jgi:SHS2 domain-containing protein
VRLEAGDDAVLLADWIGELEFLAETAGLYPREADLDVAGGRLEATVRGTTGDPPHVVKAVTYHRLALERRDGGWHATVVLDV